MERARRLGQRAAALALAMGLLTGPVIAGTTSYTYDAWGRLTSATYANGNSTIYSYDAAGNRTQVATAAPPAASPVSMTVAANSTNALAPLVITGSYTSVAVATAPAHGTATVSGLTIKYTPSTSYAGPDSFTYTATGGGGTSAPAAVTIAVAPQAKPVSATVATNSSSNPVTLSVVGAYVSVALASFPGHRSATPSGTAISYTPATGYWGADSFQYTATNAVATSAPATVGVTINPPAPIAQPVSATVSNVGAQPVTLSFSAAGGPPTSVAVSTGATHGAAAATGTSISYTANSGYTGADSFQYTGSNGAGMSAPAAATLTVLAAYRATINAGSSGSGHSSSHVFPPNAVTVTGGSGSYTYQWTKTDDGAAIWTAAGTTATQTVSVSRVPGGGEASVAYYTCTVTDTVTHAITTSNSARYYWQNTGS